MDWTWKRRRFDHILLDQVFEQTISLGIFNKLYFKFSIFFKLFSSHEWYHINSQLSLRRPDSSTSFCSQLSRKFNLLWWKHKWTISSDHSSQTLKFTNKRLNNFRHSNRCKLWHIQSNSEWRQSYHFLCPRSRWWIRHMDCCLRKKKITDRLFKHLVYSHPSQFRSDLLL